MKLLARCLVAVLGTIPGARLSELKGGSKRNVIARESDAVLLVPTASLEQLQTEVARQLSFLQAEYGLIEPGLELTLTLTSAGGEEEKKEEEGGQALGSECVKKSVMKCDEAARLLGLLGALPHGVIKRSHAIAGKLRQGRGEGGRGGTIPRQSLARI